MALQLTYENKNDTANAGFLKSHCV